jgi:hypothetical protein
MLIGGILYIPVKEFCKPERINTSHSYGNDMWFLSWIKNDE